MSPLSSPNVQRLPSPPAENDSNPSPPSRSPSAPPSAPTITSSGRHSSAVSRDPSSSSWTVYRTEQTSEQTSQDIDSDSLSSSVSKEWTRLDTEERASYHALEGSSNLEGDGESGEADGRRSTVDQRVEPREDVGSSVGEGENPREEVE